MASMKMVALPKQAGLGLAESIENAVGDVKQPGGQRENECLGKRQVKVHGANEEPRPESRNRWGIETEEMPPFRKVVDTPCQTLVYVCCPNECSLANFCKRTKLSVTPRAQGIHLTNEGHGFSRAVKSRA